MASGSSWQSIDHTGDAGILVRAGTREALHEQAAAAMFEILLDPATVRPECSWPVAVEGQDREDLMVRWLSELLFLHETRGIALARFEILQLTDRELSATVYGEPLDASRHVLRTMLKAVTYHALLVTEDRLGSAGDDGWTARIIFDV